MTAICPGCTGTETEDFGEFRGVHPAFKNLRKSRCAFCGLIFADPMPEKSLLDDYNQSYFDTAHGGAATSRIANAFFTALARLRFQHIDDYCVKNQIRVTSVLEFGPGVGHLAQVWLERHPDTRYSAVETDETCHAALSEIGVNLVSDSGKLERAQFDAVVMSHVLEHTDTPREFLALALSRLKTGGVLFIEVPCLDYVHKDVDEPHLLFFDKQSLELLLGQLGVANLKLSYHGKALSSLKAKSRIKDTLMKVRTKLISLGLPFLFSRAEPGLRKIRSSTERAVIKPFHAHIEKSEPAWWVRAVGVKR